ncbi:hypothetical protein ATANTOWER_027508 [Ataeniobius toweri]|uniref:Uncharacterized protein n=1 Tax=Ataeniobius toweri TaxID=208326 RepID=A0ABU7A8A2_9TELE|nr:hypothetical protein [Ataeniobius toweri]
MRSIVLALGNCSTRRCAGNSLETVNLCKSQREKSSHACTLIIPFMNESTRYTNSDSFVLNLVHMIDDRMTLLDPVEELCLFASKKTLARWVSLSRPLCDLRRRDRFLGIVGVLYGQWHHGKSAEVKKKTHSIQTREHAQHPYPSQK